MTVLDRNEVLTWTFCRPSFGEWTAFCWKRWTCISQCNQRAEHHDDHQNGFIHFKESRMKITYWQIQLKKYPMYVARCLLIVIIQLMLSDLHWHKMMRLSSLHSNYFNSSSMKPTPKKTKIYSKSILLSSFIWQIKNHFFSNF